MNEGMFVCSAGKDRLALSCEGLFWGCELFSDYFKGRETSKAYQDYCFGEVGDLMKKNQLAYHEKSLKYRWLRMSLFHTSNQACSRCNNLMECRICPIDAALTSCIGEIPEWICQSKKIFMKEKKLFWDTIALSIEQ
jgi:hypothetical protein